MEIYAGQKKMVAGADYYIFDSFRLSDFNRNVSYRADYIYIILKGLFMDKIINALKYIFAVWKKAGRTIGRAVNFVFLIILYFIFLAPIAIIKKLLNLKKKPPADSYWSEHQPEAEEGYKNQF